MSEHGEPTVAESKKNRLSEVKREAILDAAVQEFRSVGYANTSMDRIADVANVSKRTVYNHFPSKEELFAAIVQRLKARCGAMTSWPNDSQAPLSEQLTAIGWEYAELMSSADMHDLAQVILPRFLQTPELSKQLLGDTKPGQQRFIEWLGHHQQAGRLCEGDVMLLAGQFLSCINAFVFWPQLLGGDPPLDEDERRRVVDSAVELFLTRYLTR